MNIELMEILLIHTKLLNNPKNEALKSFLSVLFLGINAISRLNYKKLYKSKIKSNRIKKIRKEEKF